MSEKRKATFMCCICGEGSEKGPELCSINLHRFADLELNEKGNGYKGSFQQGAVHASCIEPYLPQDGLDGSSCVVCGKQIRGMLSRGTKIAIYRYRKRGCSEVLSFHDRCFKKIKAKEFPLMKFF